MRIFREANRCANVLANIWCGQVEDLIVYEQCLVYVGPLLVFDVARNSILRFVYR